MSERPGYWLDPYRVELQTEVVEATVDAAGQAAAVLADTLLYPEGGGQPTDRGWVGDVPVTAVVRRGGRVVHLLERPVAVGPVTVRLDWERRFDHMQQHSAQHLVTAIADDRCGWPTTAFHLGPETSDVELAAPRLRPDDLSRLEAAVAAEVRAARPIAERWTTAAEMEAAGARCRGLPNGFAGAVRLIEIEGVDLAACGGTHLRSTAEIEAVCLLGSEPLRGGTRVFLVAGGRVRARMAAHEERNVELRTLLGAPDVELVATAAAKLEQLQRATRSQRKLLADLGAAVAREIARRQDAVVAEHFTHGGQELVQAVARELPASGFAGLALLTVDSGHFALVSGHDEPRLGELGRAVAEVLAARGGGSGRVFQGKAEAIQRHAEAVERLRGMVVAVQGGTAD